MVGMKCGDRLDGYDLLEEIGRGGMGVVFRARERSLNRDVALKILLPGLASEAEYVDRFKREAQIVATLRHPNIVSILAYGEADGCHYFAMEYVAGRDLGQLLKERTTLSIEEALSITAQAARALDAANAKSIIHRDIKPSNIMIDETGHAYITDFGIARLAESDELTRTGTFFSTPEYAAPEQATGGTVDVRSDIYSLGAVLYKCLSGVPPVSADSAAAIVVKSATEGASPLSAANRLLPAPLCALVDGMLAFEPVDRPQSPQDLLAAIAECEIALECESSGSIDRTVAIKGSPTGEQAARPRRWSPVVAAAAAFLLLLAVVGGFNWTRIFPTARTHPDISVSRASLVDVAAPGVAGAALVNDYAEATALPQAGSVAAEPSPIEPSPIASTRASRSPAPAPLPKRPAVLVVAFGDEPMVSLVRSRLSSGFLAHDLDVISVNEIPLLRSRGRFGRRPWSVYEIQQYVPTSRAQVVVLAEILKTGASTLRYYGRSDLQTHASLSVQAIDTATGHSIHSESAPSIQFTSLNMGENIENAVVPVANGVGSGIEQYWSQKRR